MKKTLCEELQETITESTSIQEDAFMQSGIKFDVMGSYLPETGEIFLFPGTVATNARSTLNDETKSKIQATLKSRNIKTPK